MSSGFSKLFSTLCEIILQLKILGLQGATSIEVVTAATRNLNLEQLKAALSTTNLTKEQIKQVLAAHGVAGAELETMAATIANTTATGAATTATGLFTGATVSLKAALKGLWATMMSNPLTAIITIALTLITVISRVVSSIKQARQEAQQLAIDSGKSAVQSGKDLYSALTKYMDLKEAIDAGTGSSEDFANAQQNVLDALGVAKAGIDKLIEKYGSLHEAIIQVSKDKLNTDISVALSGVKEAKGQVEDELKTGWFGGNSKYFSSIGEEAGEIMSYLESKGFTGIDNTGSKGGGTIFLPSVYSTGGDTSKATFEDLMADYQYLQDMMNTIREGFGTDNDLFTQVSELYNQYAKQLDPVIEQINGANELIAEKLLLDFEGEVTNYDEFIALRNDLIEKLKSDKDFAEGGESAESIIDSLLGSDADMVGYYDKLAKLEELEAKVKKVKEAFNSSKWFQNANWTVAEDRLNDFNDWFDDLSEEDKEAVYEIVCNTDVAEWNLQDWQNALSDANEYTAQTLGEIETKYSSAAESTKLLADGISSVQDVLSSQTTGASISIEDFNSEELKDYTSTLEYHNGVLQLNAEKVRDIVEAKANEQIEINNTNKAMAQSKYLENAAQIEKYRKELKESTTLSEEQKAVLQGKIDVLLDENSAIKETCDSYDIMTSSLKESTNAYNNWLNAQNAAQSGDMFDDTIDAINRINETLNDSESEFFGRIGRTDFQAAIDLIVPDSVDKEDTENVNSYLESVKDLFTFTDDGDYSGLNIQGFLNRAVEQGLMTVDEAGTDYRIAGQKTMEDFAEGLGLSLPLVQAMFGELEEFGAEFSWADEANKTIGDLAVSANVAAENLRGLHQDLEITLDVSDIESADGKTNALKGTIEQMQDLKSKPGVDSSEIEYANSIIEYCIAQMQQLSEPAIMDVDVSKVSETTAEAVSLIQEFQRACNDLELKQALGLDASEAQAKVDELYSQITSSDNDALIALKLDTTSVETVKTSISELSIDDVKAKLQVDDTALVSYVPEDKEATVRYKVDSSKVDAYNPSNLSRTVTYYTRTVGSVKVNGTANASGTAKASGDWGTAEGGSTLTGELGREIVVDPHTGKWYTVGDTGAEFVNIPQGAIVFNHKQTESLLKNGYVAGRASALVGGTAMVTGGINIGKIPGYTPPSSGSSGGNGNSGGGSSSSSSSSSSSDKEPEAFDWIEVAIDRIERAIDRLKNTATSAYKALKTKLGATASEITAVNQELAIQEQAYTRYLQQANSVGLSSNLAERVRNGSIDINEYDEDTKKLIEDYKEWYEKALDCADAIDELHENLASLYEDNFNNIKDDFDNQLELYEHMSNTYETGLDKLEAKGMLESTKYYTALSNVEKQNIGILDKELDSLIQSFSEAMASGEIEEGSEAWYSMQQNINETKEAIDEANLSLLEYAKTMREIEWGYFDYTQERISQLTEESDFLIDLMSSAKLYDDKGKLTDEGLSTMGLHGVNYNVYMAQADDYAAEILKLDKEIANDPYNTDLIKRREELLGLQRDSILAAEDEKQAIVDMVEEGIQYELASLKELIDTYTESLDSAKSLYDYQKKIEEKTQNIASLQKQLSAYSNDVSEETKAKVQKITVELREAKEDLQQTEYEQFITDTKKLLDDLYIEYEEVLNQRLDDVDALISDMIDTVNTNSGTINTTITETADSVGYTLTSEMSTIWSNAVNSMDGVIAKYDKDYSSQLTSVNSVLGTISANVAAMIEESNKEAEQVIADTTPTTEPRDVPAPQKPSTPTTPSAPSAPSTPTRSDKDNYGVALAIINGNYGWGNGDTRKRNLQAKGFNYNTVQGIVNKLMSEGYVNSGAWVGRYYGIKDLSPYHYNKYLHGGLIDYTGIAQVDGTPGKPELMLNAEDTENFIKLRDVLRAMSSQALTMGSSFGFEAPSLIGINDVSNRLASLRGGVTNGGTNVGDISITIPIEHVDDYNDFITQLQKDKQFEQLIQSMTIDRLAGGSPLAKNKFKW